MIYCTVIVHTIMLGLLGCDLIFEKHDRKCYFFKHLKKRPAGEKLVHICLGTNLQQHDVTDEVYLQSIKQLLDETEQSIVICQWRTDQLFADAAEAEGNS